MATVGQDSDKMDKGNTQKGIVKKGIAKITRARSQLLLKHPFYGHMSIRLQLSPWDQPHLMGTDGVSLFFNPSQVAGIPMSEVIGVTVHEVDHIINRHHLRRGGRDMMKWNIATDAAINPLIKQEFSLPKGAIDMPEFYGMPAEEIYNKLPKMEEGQRMDLVLDHPGLGERGEDGISGEAGMQEIEQNLKQMVGWAYREAKKQGSVPGHISRLVDDMVNPKVPWQVVLARFVTQNAKDDFTWRMPNRRYTHCGWYLPSLKSERLRTGVFAGDTSGSINSDALKSEVSELMGVLSVFPSAEVFVIWCDSKVAGEEWVRSIEDAAQVKPKGGGGTDFRPVFKRIEEMDEEVAYCIYATDGYCDSFPRTAPDYPVMWLLGDGSTDSFNPPFGEVVRV